MKDIHSSDLKKKNLENLVSFYKEELKRVADGERATEVFTHQERGNLRAAGILRYSNMKWYITEKVRVFVERLD